jgi:hypothetical protein
MSALEGFLQDVLCPEVVSDCKLWFALPGDAMIDLNVPVKRAVLFMTCIHCTECKVYFVWP